MEIKLVPAQFADAELAVVLRNLLLRFVAQSFLQFLEILRNLIMISNDFDLFKMPHLSWPASLFLASFC